MRVGYFTQYQVEELDGADTPLGHMTRVMSGKTPGAVRAQLGRFGFTGNKAVTKVGKLSGGERARLALALITRDAQTGRAHVGIPVTNAPLVCRLLPELNKTPDQ